jgi:hypothetical protein
VRLRIRAFLAREAAIAKERKRRDAQKVSSLIGDAGASGSGLPPSHIETKVGGLKGRATSTAAKEAKHSADLAVAKFLFMTGTPISRVDSIPFIAMIKAVSGFEGYELPSSLTFRHRLLNEVYTGVKESIQPIFDGLKVTGGTIISDGWTDVQGNSLINVLLHTPSKTAFLKAVNTKGEV